MRSNAIYFSRQLTGTQTERPSAGGGHTQPAQWQVLPVHEDCAASDNQSI